MKKIVSFWRTTGLLIASTIGAGIFSLPYVFTRVGWALGLFFLLVVAALLALVHATYAQALEVNDAGGALGMIWRRLGRTAFFVGSLAIIGGLLLALTAYLILSSSFVHTIAPGIPTTAAIIGFWLLAMLPLRGSLRLFARAELFGTCMVGLAIIVIFLTAPQIGFGAAPTVQVDGVTLALSAALFSLAAWTSIEPIVAANKKSGISKGAVSSAIVLGTGIAATLYVLFVLGVLGSTPVITSDTLTGLAASAPQAKVLLLAVLGLIALWASYLPLSREVSRALAEDYNLGTKVAFAIVAFVPFALVFSGFNSFIRVVELSGGVFLTIEYMLIILASRTIVKPKGLVRFGLNIALVLFFAAALYEAYHFIVG